MIAVFNGYFSPSILRRVFILFFLLHGSLLFASSEKTVTQLELTQKEQNWILEHPTILVGGSPDWTPFNFVALNGEYSGIANDYLNLIAKKTGLKFSVSIDQWSNNLQKIRDGRIDLLGAVYYTDERTQFLTYSSPYFEVLDYFFIRNDLIVETLDDLNGKRVAIPHGYAHLTFLKKHFPTIKIVLVDTFGDAIDAVLENRADLLYDTYGSLIYTLEKEGVNTIIPFKSTRQYGKNPIHIVTRKDNPELSAIIQKGLNTITVQEKREIYDKWLGEIAKSESSLQLSVAEQNWIKNHPIIRYGAEKDWKPFDFINEQGKHDGLTKEYLQLISRATGIKFIPIFDDWNKLLDLIKQKEINLLPALYFSKARNQHLTYTHSYLSILDYFFVHEGIQADTMSDLDGKTLAIPKGYTYIETVRQQFPQIKIILTENLTTAIQSVIERKADILLESYAVINYQLKKTGIATIRPFKAFGTDAQADLFMAVPHEYAIFANILNKSLSAIPESEKKRINNKWLGYQPENQIKRIKLNPTEREWLSEHPVIRYTGDPNWLPYEAFNQQGEYIGIAAEYLKLIEQKLGITLEISTASTWSDAVNKVKQGEIDILSETTDSNLRSHLNFTQPYLSSSIVIVMKKDQQYVENIEQINQQKIALIKDYGYASKIINQYPEIYFYRANTIQEGLIDLSTGKIDALLASLAHASYYTTELGINNIRIVGKTEFSSELAFGIRKDFAPLIPLFNRALNAITQSEKRHILNTWGKQSYATKIDYVLLAKIAGIFIFIILVFIYWNRVLTKEIELRKEIEAQTQALIDYIPLQIIVTSFQGYILTANPKALNDYNLNQDELALFTISDFYHDPEERTQVFKELREKGKVDQKIIQFNRFDGTLRSMMISIMPINYHKQIAYLTIAVDITERIEMESALQKAKESAEAANSAKSEFLANMSHEIRTPMNAILGFTELLNEQVEDPKLKSFIKTIQSAGKNLLSIINDILDLSKIEAGKLEIEKAPCNLHELFTELGDIFMLKMREKNIDFILDIDPTIPPSLLIDALRLKQVLLNLIGNAVKFTDQGSIQVKARTANKNVINSKLDLVIEVQDTGLGVSEDQQKLIFQNFEQSRGQDSKKFGGTGLGLSISKRLIEMMGGDIALNSQLGQGSTFSVTLREIFIASVNPEAEIKRTEQDSIINFHAGNILIVDDIKDNRDLLLAIFSTTKLNIAVVENGLEAVKTAKQQVFDLILMDIHMPIMNGYQAAAEIKTFSDVPIIALTASVMRDEFEQLKNESFVSYLRKPILKDALINELCKYLSFEKTAIATPTKIKVYLTADEQHSLPDTLIKLKQLKSQHENITNNNNIPEIEAFAKAILQISTISALRNYAQQLLSHIDSFDIGAIKLAINEFPELLDQLTQGNFEIKEQNAPDKTG